MARLLHWVVPHSSNHYHPPILRTSGLFLIVIVLAFIPTIYNLTTAGTAQILGYATDISISGLNSASNQQRAANGAPALNLNGALNQAAANKAADMFAKNYWAHNSPDGTTPWYFISSAGYSYSSAGENLAKNFLTSNGVVNAWMNSPEHRANLINSTFVDVGYAVMNGVLQGSETTLVVAMYGTPKAAPAPAAPVTPAAPPAAAQQAPASQTRPSQAAPIQQATPEAAAPVEETSEVSPEATPVATPDETSTVAPEAAQAAASQESKEIKAVTTEDVLGALAAAPVKAYSQFNWGQKATLFILAVITLLFVMSHTLLWRAQKRGFKHIWFRAHPLAQASALGAAFIVVLMSGTGVIL